MTAGDPFGQGCLVLVNDEGQYSLWPLGRDVPAGWLPTGFRGDRNACMDYVEGVWTDMRPISLRGMDADGQERTT